MNIKTGLANIFINLINAAGTILSFLGFLIFSDTKEISLLIIGVFLILISEAAGIYLIKYEERKKLDRIKDDFLKNVGSTFAWPLLLFFAYMLSRNQAVLELTFILTLIATIKVTSLIIKVYVIDKSII